METDRGLRLPDHFARGIRPWCVRDGCTRLAVYQPVLQFRVHQGHPPAEAMLGIGVCPTCREQHGTVEDYLTDEGFEQVAVGIQLQGKARPVRALTTLRWVELPAVRA